MMCFSLAEKVVYVAGEMAEQLRAHLALQDPAPMTGSSQLPAVSARGPETFFRTSGASAYGWLSLTQTQRYE